MTSENATRDRSQGTFWRKSAKSNPKGHFFFFFLSRQANTGNANKKQISNSNFFEQVVIVPSCEWAHMHIIRRGIYGRILGSMGAWVYPAAGDNVLDRDVVKLIVRFFRWG